MSEEIITTATNVRVARRVNEGLKVTLTIDHIRDLVESIGVDRLLEGMRPEDIASFFSSYAREAEARELLSGLPSRLVREFSEDY